MAMGAEEFEAELNAADMTGDLSNQRLGCCETRYIKGEKQGIMAHAVFLVRVLVRLRHPSVLRRELRPLP